MIDHRKAAQDVPTDGRDDPLGSEVSAHHGADVYPEASLELPQHPVFALKTTLAQSKGEGIEMAHAETALTLRREAGSPLPSRG